MSDSCLFAVEAEQLLFAGMYDDAIEVCLEGIRKFPDYSSAYIILYKSYKEKGDYTKAYLTLNRAFANFPYNRIIHKEKELFGLEIKENNFTIDLSIDDSFLNPIEINTIEEFGSQVEPSTEIIDTQNLEDDLNIKDKNTEEIDIDSELEQSENTEVAIDQDASDLIIQEILPDEETPQLLDNFKLQDSNFQLGDTSKEETKDVIQNASNLNDDQENLDHVSDLENDFVNDIEIIDINPSDYTDEGFISINEIEKEDEIDNLIINNDVENKFEELIHQPELENISHNINSKRLSLIKGLESKDIYKNHNIKLPFKIKIYQPEFSPFVIVIKDNNNLKKDKKSSFEETQKQLISLAEKLINSKIPKIDEEYYEEVAEVNNDNNVEIVSETIAQIYENQGAYPEAIKSYLALSEINPDKQHYYIEKIKFLENLGNL